MIKRRINNFLNLNRKSSSCQFLSSVSDSFQFSIEHAQKYVSYLAQCVQQLNHKTSKVRDAGDEIAKLFLDFIEKDTNNNSENDSNTKKLTKNNENIQYTCEENFDFYKSLRQYSMYFSLVEDHRDSMVYITKIYYNFTNLLKSLT